MIYSDKQHKEKKWSTRDPRPGTESSPRDILSETELLVLKTVLELFQHNSPGLPEEKPSIYDLVGIRPPIILCRFVRKEIITSRYFYAWRNVDQFGLGNLKIIRQLNVNRLQRNAILPSLKRQCNVSIFMQTYIYGTFC